MGQVASIVDNALIESFWSTMQRALLDLFSWDPRSQLSSAMFEWIDGFYDPTRQHTAVGNLSPIEFEAFTPPLRLPHNQEEETVWETGSGPMLIGLTYAASPTTSLSLTWPMSAFATRSPTPSTRISTSSSWAPSAQGWRPPTGVEPFFTCSRPSGSVT